jgi:hypothetical protein
MIQLKSKNLSQAIAMAAAMTLAGSIAYGQVTIPETYVLPSSAGVPSARGFIWNISQVDASEPNLLSWAESQLSGEQGPNLADPNAAGEDAVGAATAGSSTSAPISFTLKSTATINFSKADGDTSHVSPGLASVGITQLNQMPGLPGTGGSTDNAAAEALVYLDLPAGTNTMGVRSDDGFRVTIGGAAPNDKYSAAAKVVGSFDGGRGAADTIFKFVVTKAGIYAVRLVWENGGGDANVEWFTAKPDGTNYVLINDTANGGIPAYASVGAPAAAYATTLSPAPGSVGASPQPTVKAILADGPTQLDSTKITLSFNGASVTPTVARSGSKTTVTYTPSVLLGANAAQNVVLTYVDGSVTRSNVWSFKTGNFATVAAAAAVAPNTGKPGFKFNIFANGKALNKNYAVNNDFRDTAEQSLNGLALDLSDITIIPPPAAPNLADVSKVGSAVGAAPALASATAPAEFEIAGTIGFTPTTTPGLPGTDGSTDNVNGEILTYVSLPAGLTSFGITSGSRDLYRVYFGSWDYTAGSLAAHLNVYSTPDSQFYVVAPVAGVYPMRLVWNHVADADPGLSIYTISADGSQHKLNDVANGGLAAYRALAAKSEPYVKFTSPSPTLRQMVYPAAAVVVNIADGDLGVDDASPVLTLDGKTVTVTKTRVGDYVSVKYTPTTLQTPSEIHTATISFKDKAGKALSQTWSFMNLKSIWLPANWVAGENFDSYPGDGTVFNTPATEWSTNWSNPFQPDATKWYVYSYSGRETEGEGLDSVNTDSFLSWLAIPGDTFAKAEGDIANVNPMETYNGQPVSAPLYVNNIFVAESDNRSGDVTKGQVQFAYSKAYDLSAVSNPVVAWASLYKQNQDSLGGIEYSVDGGTNWAPVIYYLDGGSYNSSAPDVFANDADGTMDAVKTFTIGQGDVPVWKDWFGQAKGGNYGDGIAAPITQALSPFVAPRVNDDKYEGKRWEAVRLPLAANKKDVRLRFSQLGTCSWYIGVDNVGFYDIAPSGAQVPTGIASATASPLVKSVSVDGTTLTVTFQGGTLQSSPSLINPTWTTTGNSTGSYTETVSGVKFFRVLQ